MRLVALLFIAGVAHAQAAARAVPTLGESSASNALTRDTTPSSALSGNTISRDTRETTLDRPAVRHATRGPLSSTIARDAPLGELDDGTGARDATTLGEPDDSGARWRRRWAR